MRSSTRVATARSTTPLRVCEYIAPMTEISRSPCAMSTRRTISQSPRPTSRVPWMGMNARIRSLLDAGVSQPVFWLSQDLWFAESLSVKVSVIQVPLNGMRSRRHAVELTTNQSDLSDEKPSDRALPSDSPCVVETVVLWIRRTCSFLSSILCVGSSASPLDH